MNFITKSRSAKWAVLLISGLALFTDMVIYGVIMPIIEELIAKCGVEKSNWANSALVVTYAVGLLIFTPLFGSLSDRYRNRRIPMLIGQAGLAASTVLFALAKSFPLLLLARFLQGVAGAATWVVGMAMLTDVFNGPHLGFYMSIVYSCHTLGFFLGPLIGGFLHSKFSLEAPFYVCTALALVDLVGRLWIKEPKIKDLDKKAAAFKGKGIIELLKCPEILLITAVITFKAGSFSSLESKLEDHLATFGYDSQGTSLVFLAFILPSIFVGYVVGWLGGKMDRFKLITIGMIAHPLAMPLACSASSVNLVIIGGILFGCSASFMGTPVTPELANIVESLGGASYARVYAILNAAYSVGMIIGPIATTAIAEKTNFMWGMLGFNSMMLIYAPFFFYFMSKLVVERKARLEELKDLAVVDQNIEKK
jgi:DHA1 family solute carrier family 18 vesicular amine transporter 1/2